MRRRRHPYLWLLAIAFAAGCGGAPGPPAEPVHQIERLAAVSPTIYSGGEPHGERDFALLAHLGVKTIVSVDGARPGLESAARHGLRYVHIPIGYDGVPREAAAALTRVMRECPTPIFIHCHHGQHRGPAAAAIACIAAGEKTNEQAVDYLERAGTGRQYGGLWRDVERFEPLVDGEPLPELHEVALVSSFVQAMADMGRHFDHLAACRAAGWSAPADHPDLDPYHEALMLVEGFREAVRHVDDAQRETMGEALQESLGEVKQLHAALAIGDAAQADALLASLGRSCKACHTVHRDGT